MSSFELESSLFNQQQFKPLQCFSDNGRVIVGLVTTTEDRISLELNCSLCTDVFNDLELFFAHIETNHPIAHANRDSLPIESNEDDGTDCDIEPLEELHFKQESSLNNLCSERSTAARAEESESVGYTSDDTVVENLSDDETSSDNQHGFKVRKEEKEIIDKKKINSPTIEFVKDESDSEEVSSFKQKENDVEQIDFLIDLYKKHPVLWDPGVFGYTSTIVRNRTFIKIAKEINEKFSSQLSASDVRTKISRLRLRRAAEIGKIAANENTTSNLWYFNKLSFANCEKFFSKKAISELEMEKTQFLIELYKKHRVLWDPRVMGSQNTFIRNQAFVDIAKEYSEKYNEQKTAITVKAKFRNLRSKFKADLLNVNSENKKPRIWYYDQLSFLGIKYGIPTANSESKSGHQISKKSCDICSHLFFNEISLKNHKFKKHGIKSFVCEVCKKVYPSSLTLREHSYSHMSVEDRPHACKICGARFSQRTNRAIHERRHTKSFSFSCNICEKRFVTSAELQGHIRIHTGEKPFVCDKCGILFRTSSLLANHRKTHQQARTFKCTLCPKAFQTQTRMKIHLKTHSDSRNYECNICGNRFKTKKTLYQHQQLHSENKKYICKICEQSFSQQAGLHCHLKTHDIAKNRHRK